jgi:hypothetical protein
MKWNSTSLDWPALPFAEWAPTCDTLHMWTQIAGKTRMCLTPLENHWWNAALYVTPRGLGTHSIPYRNLTFDVEFDFVAHRLLIRTSDGDDRSVALGPRSVADFYGDYQAQLRSLGIEVKLKTEPDEFDDPTPYDQDHKHASYDKEYVERFRRVLINTDRILKQFRGRFLGKSSPVHFFWGSFDLTVTRFSGRRAPEREGADHMTKEAYSHEEMSCGFWPGDRRFPQPAFYAYNAPSPPGLDKEPVRPGGWNTQLSEFILKYDDVRTGKSPDADVLSFCQGAYEAGARLAHWDIDGLERKD